MTEINGAPATYDDYRVLLEAWRELNDIERDVGLEPTAPTVRDPRDPPPYVSDRRGTL